MAENFTSHLTKSAKSALVLVWLAPIAIRMSPWKERFEWALAFSAVGYLAFLALAVFHRRFCQWVSNSRVSAERLRGMMVFPLVFSMILFGLILYIRLYWGTSILSR